jgi:transcriptional regulator of nitric oxide reductase
MHSVCSVTDGRVCRNVDSLSVPQSRCNEQSRAVAAVQTFVTTSEETARLFLNSLHYVWVRVYERRTSSVRIVIRLWAC